MSQSHRMAVVMGGFAALLLLGPALLAQPSVDAGCRQAGSPFDWAGKNVLWLGTSIPHQGLNTHDSYPEIFCAMMGCRVVNNAFSGSHIRWEEQRPDESCRSGRNAPKGLSATRRELRAKQQAALPDDGTSAYDKSCSPVVDPLLMGYHDRINARWARSSFDAVFIDHGHNDRPVRASNREALLGTLHAQERIVSSIEKGAVTRVLMHPGHGLRVYDDVTLRTPGIPRMDYWTGEIAAISGDTLTLDFDSSGLAGAYTGGGHLVRYDKSKLYDAYNLVISDVLHMNAHYGGPRVLIVLTTPPTEWTGGRNDGSIAAVNQALERIAGKWGLPLYPMTSRLHINAANLRTFLPDTVHPTTASARELIARDLAQWARETPLVFDACANRWSPSGASPRR